MPESITELAKLLKPFLLSVAQTVVVGGTSAAPSPHDLNSAHHTGTLADAQAAQFLKTDGSRSLTGNLAVVGGITIDGVDIDIFKVAYDTHLGADAHSMYLNIARHDLTARHTLGTVVPHDVHSALSGLTGTDSHTDYMHNTNARTVSAIHTLTNGLNIGADVTLNRKAADVLQLAAGDAFQSSTYTSGISGWNIASNGSAEFENVRVRGELVSTIFKAQEIQATAGTFGVFKSASTLTADATLPALLGSVHLFFKTSDAAPSASLFAVNDVIRIKSWNGSAVTDSWLTITAQSSAAGVTDATCTLNSGSASVALKAGTAVVDYGVGGTDGFITLSADGALGSSANISIAKNAANPWNAPTLLARMGNLNNSYGIVANTYGMGVGDFGGGNYLSYDGTNFKIVAGAGNVTLDTNGLTITSSSAMAGSSVLWKAGATETAVIARYNGVGGATNLDIVKDRGGAYEQSITLRQYLGITTTNINSNIINLNGNVAANSTLTASQLVSNTATGTAPLAVTSTTAVANLNADMVDGYHIGMAASSIPYIDGNQYALFPGKVAAVGISGNAYGTSLQVAPPGGANDQYSGIMFNATFGTGVADYTPRRAADIVAGFKSANSWGGEFLAFGVGGATDTGLRTTERMRLDAIGLHLGAANATVISDGVGIHISGKIIRMDTSKTPASAAAAGNAGEICWDTNYVYVCTAANTWKRAGIGTW